MVSDVDRGLDNFTPLHFASCSGNLIIMQLLIRNGAHIDALSSYNRTPLHVACLSSKYEAVQLLIKEGADINKQDNDLDTALHIATKNASSLLVEFLLQKQADTFIQNNDNHYPFQLTTSKNVLKVYAKYGIKNKSTTSTLFKSLKKYLSSNDLDDYQ